MVRKIGNQYCHRSQTPSGLAEPESPVCTAVALRRQTISLSTTEQPVARNSNDHSWRGRDPDNFAHQELVPALALPDQGRLIAVAREDQSVCTTTEPDQQCFRSPSESLRKTDKQLERILFTFTSAERRKSARLDSRCHHQSRVTGAKGKRDSRSRGDDHARTHSIVSRCLRWRQLSCSIRRRQAFRGR